MPPSSSPTCPGWDVALALARVGRHALRGTSSRSERYYRLGAGVLGALRRLQSQRLRRGAADRRRAGALLAQLRRERRLMTTGEVIAYFDRALTARSEVVDGYATSSEAPTRTAFP